MELSEAATLIISTLADAGFTPYIVGGAVRDHFMKLEPKDFDIEVHGCKDMTELYDSLINLYRVDAVGRQFGVLKVTKGNETIDVSLPRRDSKTGVGHTGFQVEVDPSMTLEEALARRDFTINAIAFDPFTSEFIDPFRGLDDLRAGVLRHTSMAFGEDPLRVIRGVQFAARFNMEFALSTALICRSLKSSFKELAVERLWDEWVKLFVKGKSFLKAQMALSQCGWEEFYPDIWEIDSPQMDRLQTACRVDGLSEEQTIISVLASIRRQAPETFAAINPLDKSIRRDALKLGDALKSGEFFRLNGDDCARVARSIAPLSIRDLARIEHDRFGGASLAHVLETAKELGVLDGPLSLFITGQDLIERGLDPSPLFKVIIDHFTTKRDDLEHKSRRAALRELDTICKDLVS
jgi:tRNA nucleotidyltransferase/poly(A) polymerase